MIDAKDLAFLEHRLKLAIQRHRRGEARAEGLFHQHPPAKLGGSAGWRLTQTRLTQPADDGAHGARRNCQVEGARSEPPVLAVEGCEAFGETRVAPGVVVVSP